MICPVCHTILVRDVDPAQLVHRDGNHYDQDNNYIPKVVNGGAYGDGGGIASDD